jgi:hypothetical protein
MMAMVIQRLDAISAHQRGEAARVDRLEMGLLSLLPSRAEELSAEGGKGQEAGDGSARASEAEGTISPFQDDQGYDYAQWPESKGPPFGDRLVALENAERVVYSKPDLIPEEDGVSIEPVEEERKIAYYTRMICWLAMHGARNRPLWFPAKTYNKQEHGMTFTVGLQPHRPLQVHDLRGWIPESGRGQGTVHRAIARLVYTGTVKQMTWGRGVVVYCGAAPQLR